MTCGESWDIMAEVRGSNAVLLEGTRTPSRRDFGAAIVERKRESAKNEMGWKRRCCYERRGKSVQVI